MKIGRILIVFVLIALAVLIGIRANRNIQAKKLAMSQPAPERIIPVETTRPVKQEITENIHATGGIQADSEVAIFSKVSGKITLNNVQLGSLVQPGQVVAIVTRDEVGYDFKPFEIKSDTKGVVSRLLLTPGAVVTPNTPLLNLVDIDTVKAVAAVDEKKIRFINPGQFARVTLEAYPGEVFSARVTTISPICNPVSRTIDVELSLPNPTHRVKPGMYAEVEWVQSRRSALVVPLVAVVDRGGKKFVFRADNGLAAQVPVTVGAVVGDAIEIVSGLQGGELIVTTGAGQLNDKDKIKIVERPADRMVGTFPS